MGGSGGAGRAPGDGGVEGGEGCPLLTTGAGSHGLIDLIGSSGGGPQPLNLILIIRGFC